MIRVIRGQNLISNNLYSLIVHKKVDIVGWAQKK